MTGATIFVMWSSLLLLLTKCRREACAAQVSPCNMKSSVKGIAGQKKSGLECGIAYILCTSGAAVKVSMTCNDGHQEEWCSSATIGTGKRTLYLINISIIVYSFLSGLHFDQLKVYFLLLNKSEVDRNFLRPFSICPGYRVYQRAHSTDILCLSCIL